MKSLLKEIDKNSEQDANTTSLTHCKLNSHIDYLRGVYQSRAATLIKCLQKYSVFKKIACTPTGGFFCWVRLHDGVDANAIALTAAPAHNVHFLPGIRCHPNPDEGTDDESLELKSWIRLCFAMLNEDEIERGITRLALAINSFCENAQS